MLPVNETFEVGEKVIISRGAGYSKSVSVVERMTKTLYILKNGMRFNRESNSARNDGMYTITSLMKATPERLRKVYAQNWRKTFHDFDFNKFDDDAIMKIAKVFKEEKDKCQKTS